MMNILRRMKLWQKFAVLAAIGTVTCVIPLTQVVQYKQNELAVAAAEDAGLDPVRTLVVLQKHLQAHRGLAAMVLSGNNAVDAERRTRQTDVNTQIALLDQQLTTMGKTRAAEPARALKTGWDQLSREVDSRSISARDSYEAHTALVEQNIVVMELVADASGLTLDPAPESHFLVTAVVDHLPRLGEAIERLRLAGQEALRSKDLSPTLRAELEHRSHTMHQLQSRAMGQLAKASAGDASVAKALHGLAEAAEKSADALHEAGEMIAASGKAGTDPARFDQLASEASAAQFKAHQAAADALEALLHTRVGITTGHRNGLLAQMAALFLLAALLGTAVVRSVTRPLGQAVQAAAAVANGDLGHTIERRGSDEAAQLLARIAQMQASLKQRQQDDEARLAETGYSQHRAQGPRSSN